MQVEHITPCDTPQLESGFLRSRAVLDLSLVVASCVFEWAKSNGVQSLKSEDIETVMQMLRLLAERQNGGR
ncbi:hypothetical protein PWF83_18585 [Pantoea dispersa]|uniref:hypothetical protein n=1 Tax=Pantoea dispersa TaxID=59814 RepID=UPI0023A9DB07|nr:hypothetical protein [Pantoea dispersa]WEA05674.1 hypothetical protein PWF83_18585 [Pantoea dispersa]